MRKISGVFLVVLWFGVRTIILVVTIIFAFPIIESWTSLCLNETPMYGRMFCLMLRYWFGILCSHCQGDLSSSSMQITLLIRFTTINDFINMVLPLYLVRNLGYTNSPRHVLRQRGGWVVAIQNHFPSHMQTMPTSSTWSRRCHPFHFGNLGFFYNRSRRMPPIPIWGTTRTPITSQKEAVAHHKEVVVASIHACVAWANFERWVLDAFSVVELTRFVLWSLTAFFWVQWSTPPSRPSSPPLRRDQQHDP